MLAFRFNLTGCRTWTGPHFIRASARKRIFVALKGCAYGAMKFGSQILTWSLLLISSVVAAADISVPDAAERNDLKLLKSLLEAKNDVNVAQLDGTTALHWAAYHDNVTAAALLLKSKADADAKNRYNVTPLSLACTNGNATLVEMLLQAGANAAATLDGGETALMTAARTGRLKPVELLLQREVNVNARDWKGQTALMWAAAEGHAKVVDALLRAKADRDVSLRSGFNALFFAARAGKTEAALTLIRDGAEVNGIMKPERSGGKSVRSGTSALMLAVENGHFDLAASLLDAGANPDDQRSGFTVLHALTWVRKPNRGDGPDGEPPPQVRGTMTSLDFVRRLIAAGFDVNTRLKRGRSGRGVLNQTGATAFLMAADTADLPLMKLLVELGADPQIPNADDCTALHAAAGIGTKAPGEEAGTEAEALAAVEYLLSLGFDINAVDSNGETTVHGAAYASFPEMVRLLAARGADISVWHSKNRYGWTPLLIAQGHRPGNFKPAAATIEAVEEVMRKNGITPTKPKAFRGGDEYQKSNPKTDSKARTKANPQPSR